MRRQLLRNVFCLTALSRLWSSWHLHNRRRHFRGLSAMIYPQLYRSNILRFLDPTRNSDLSQSSRGLHDPDGFSSHALRRFHAFPHDYPLYAH